MRACVVCLCVCARACVYACTHTKTHARATHPTPTGRQEKWVGKFLALWQLPLVPASIPAAGAVRERNCDSSQVKLTPSNTGQAKEHWFKESCKIHLLAVPVSYTLCTHPFPDCSSAVYPLCLVSLAEVPYDCLPWLPTRRYVGMVAKLTALVAATWSF